ncbi:MAG: hypothetical protein F9K19_25400 [Rhizobiaceae bacterium]|nr:MAG: hypothetical protein F9K19_25400 [Rhizobiaceae bacterium]MBZ0122647.1 hypothetical protein [Roseovarius sp.]CAG0981455.1 hypothetical protein RHIZO_01760 [Rhizobiaceae bacterium]
MNSQAAEDYEHKHHSPAQHIRSEALRRIRHFLSDPSLSVYPDLKGMCERVSDSYRDRVVIELLQNAHDAHPSSASTGRIKFVLGLIGPKL